VQDARVRDERVEASERRDRRVDRGILGGRGRDLQHRSLAEPHVDSAPFRELAHAGHDRRRGMGKRECTLIPEFPPGPDERRPVPMQEAAVPPAGPFPAERGLEHDDARRRLELS
jgi:hypothetical protein